MATKSTRGRPKGSGIDDDKILAKIIQLLTKDPDMKPTTAIKAVGINDASSIRRLRDKLKSSFPAKKTARKKAAATRKPAASRKATRTKTVSTRKSASKATAAKRKTPAKKTIITRTAAANRAAAKKSVSRETVRTRKASDKTTSSVSADTALGNFEFPNPFGDFSNGMKLPTEFANLDIDNIVTSTVEKQIQLYESALKFSPLASLLRQQALLTDMMLTILRTQKEITNPLKNKR